MKSCPQCSTTYTDDLAFCLEDGTVLVSLGEPPTLGHSARLSSPPAPMIPVSKSRSSAVLTFVVLALLIAVAVLIAIIVWQTNAPNNNANPAHDPTPERSPANRNGNGNSPTPPVLPPMTSEAAEELMKDWERAQDARNVDRYESCYDRSFEGVKRTVSGKVYKYNYTEWMKDRQKTMGTARFLDVRVEGMRIRVEGDIAIIEFDQEYRTTGYADFGPKVIRAKMTMSGAKIIYEELKSSTVLKD